MKVLHVIPAVAPRYGGPSRALVEMAAALLAEGVAVLVATTDADGDGRLPAPIGEMTAYRGIPARFFRRQWSEAFKYSRPLARWLAGHVGDFDVVHVHAVFSHSSLAAAGACRRRGVPYVVRPLGSLAPWSLRQRRWLKRLLWHVGVKQMLRGAAAVHYTAEGERREAEGRLGLDNGVVIPLGIDEGALDGGGSIGDDAPSVGGAPYVLALSRLHPKKNLKSLVRAFLEATGENGLRPWRLVIAGDGAPAYVDELKRAAREEGGDGRVVFTGWLEGEAKAAALKEAALLAMPSHQENFGLSAVEAMACGVPVVVSDRVNLAPEIEAAGAGWVVSLSDGALRQALDAALRDPEERAGRGDAGRRLVTERFTWPVVAGRLVDLYRSILRDEVIHA